MSAQEVGVARIDREVLRRSISEKYGEVATNPALGFHFHTGRPLAVMLGYSDALIDKLASANVESFAGTGNPFLFGDLHPGERVVDVGCGAGFDTLIAAQQVGPTGQVLAVDMTAEMRAKTESGARAMGLTNVAGPRGIRGGTAGRRWLRRRDHQQRRREPLPGQACGIQGDAPSAHAGRADPDRGHPRAQRGAAGCEGRHRALERLNCRCSAGCRVGRTPGAGRLHRRGHVERGRRVLGKQA